MPIYIYEHIETGEIAEVVQSMNEERIYNGKNGDEKGKWQRIFTAPNVQSDTRIDPFSEKQFSEKIGKSKGKLRDVIERSAELSEKRAEKLGGEDPVKRKHFADYEKKTGAKHLQDAPKSFENKHFKVDFSKKKKKKS